MTLPKNESPPSSQLHELQRSPKDNNSNNLLFQSPPARVERVRRQVVRSCQGWQQQKPCTTTTVVHMLERQQQPLSSAAITLDAPLVHYRVDSILMAQPNDVTLLLCTPTTMTTRTTPHGDDDEQPSFSSSCYLVPCSSSPVVIKAIPLGGPMNELMALQLLQKHHDSYREEEESHVIHLLDCLMDEDNYYLVLPYLSGGDMFEKVNATNNQGLDPAEAASYFRQMAKGLLFMKQCGLAHGDVSLENVALTSNGDTTKIIDLGGSSQVPSTNNNDNPAAYMSSSQPCYGKKAYVVSNRSSRSYSSKNHKMMLSHSWNLCA